MPGIIRRRPGSLRGDAQASPSGRGQTGPTGIDTGSDPFRRSHLRPGDGAALPFAAAFDADLQCRDLPLDPRSRSTVSKRAHGAQARRPARRAVRRRAKPRSPVRTCASVDDSRRVSPATSPGWRDFNHFENVADTERSAARAGFQDIDVSLVSSPVTFDTRRPVQRIRVRRLSAPSSRPAAGRSARPIHAARSPIRRVHDEPPLTLDYWRLNIRGPKGSRVTVPYQQRAAEHSVRRDVEVRRSIQISRARLSVFPDRARRLIWTIARGPELAWFALDAVLVRRLWRAGRVARASRGTRRLASTRFGR